MTVDLKTVGASLEQLRMAKHVTRAQLATTLGWSPKTLQRIAMGQVDMKLSQFVELTTYLAVEPAEITGLAAESLAAYRQVDAEIAWAAATGDQAQLAKLERRLADSQHHHYVPWLRSELLTCQLLQAELINDQAAAQRLALKLAKRYLDFDQLTMFDLRLMSRVARYLPYGQLRAFFFNRQLVAESLTPVLLSGQAEDVLDQFYIGLLISALASGAVKAVREACLLIEQRVIMTTNYYFRSYQQFAEAVRTYLRGEEQQATVLKAQLLAGISVFAGARQFKEQVAQLETQWRQLVAMSAAARAARLA